MCIDNSRSFSAIKKIKICLIQVTDRFAKSMEKALIERIGAEKLNEEFVKQLAVVVYDSDFCEGMRMNLSRFYCDIIAPCLLNKAG